MLDEKGKVYTVRDIRDKSIWVKKKIDKSCYSVYAKMKGIKNKNTAYIRDALSDKENYYVIEEYINGDSIKRLIKDKGPMEITEVRRIILDLCDGVNCLHKNKIIHRDITASNVMVSADGTVKLIDFGISRIKKENKEKDTTILGTVGYAAPEQYGFNQTDVTSDIYSLGILINYMLEGVFPNKIKHKGKFYSVIETCINMDSKNRYQSVNELKTAIKNTVITKKDLLRIPGFRSKTRWKSIMAIMLYELFVFFMGAFFSVDTNNDKAFTLVAGFGMVLIPFLLISDYGSYIELIPFIKNKNKGVRKMWCVVLSAAVFLISFLIARIFFI